MPHFVRYNPLTCPSFKPLHESALMTLSFTLPLLLGAALSITSGLGTDARRAMAQDGTGKSTCVAQGQWLDPQDGTVLTGRDVISRAASHRVVLLGETHVIAAHHRWQTQTVAQLFAENPNMVLGFEAFPRRVQGALDRWVAGELSEEAFLKQSEWETVWRYDAELYLPLFHFARLNRVPMVALNVDRSLIAKVSADGWAKVAKDKRLGVGDPAAPEAGYVEMLGRSFGEHDNGNNGDKKKQALPTLDNPDFKRFVDVQQTWDRAMAEAIKAALDNTKDGVVVAIAGRGHIDYGFGIPAQLKDLGISDITMLSPWDSLRHCDELAPKTKGWPVVADAVFGTGPVDMAEHGEKPKLGVYIEKGKGGVLIKEVAKASLAEAMGLKKGDVIIKAAGQRVADSGDLIAIVQAMAPGTWLPLNIRRGNKTMEKVARFPAVGAHPKP